MRPPRPAHVVIGSGLTATALALTAGLTAQAATSTGWRVVFRQHVGKATVYNDLLRVAAPSKTSAWAVGGSDLSGSTAGAPLAEHWNGTKWQVSALPGGLAGTLDAVSAPAGNDVWAVSGLTGYVLHWNGTTWAVAKKWKEPTSLPRELSGVTAFSAANVWVFGGPGANPGLGTWHFTGGKWAKVTGLAGAITNASALSPTNIWALSSASSPGDIVIHFNGTSWTHIASPALSGLNFQGILALGAKNIWATGTLGQAAKLLHFNGTTWQRITVPWKVYFSSLAPDGAGGLWLSAQSRSSNQTWAVHRSAAGAWTRQQLPPAAAGGLVAITRIPGTTSMWGAGLITGTSGADATIWGRGPAA